MPSVDATTLSRSVDIVTVTPAGRVPHPDSVAIEEPLEIRLHGTPFVVTMRTPGLDRDLAAGFLLAERVIASAHDLQSIVHCQDSAQPGNVIDVNLAGHAFERATHALAYRRLVSATSACGVCGRRSIEDLLQALPRVTADWRVPTALVSSLPMRLRALQHAFGVTGGLHAAALVSAEGTVLAAAEDVGRHNAVDKVIGARVWADALPLETCLLVVSGRASFEIVQKAVMAGVTVIAAVSAPSSLAVDLARESGVMLVGFVRGDSFNVYTYPERLV